MTKAAVVLSSRILDELQGIHILVARAKLGWEKSLSQHDDYFLDGVALNLHGFYSGLERVFEKVATLIDENVPDGANWHQELLRQMSLEIPKVRPAVISAKLREELEEYRGFRHVVRNVYTYQLNPAKMESLVSRLANVIADVDVELKTFTEFLQNVE